MDISQEHRHDGYTIDSMPWSYRQECEFSDH